MNQYEVVKDLEVHDDQSPLFGTHQIGSVLDIAEADAEKVFEFVEQGFLKMLAAKEGDVPPPAPPEETPPPTTPPADESLNAEEEQILPTSVPAHPEATEHPEWKELAAAFPDAPEEYTGTPGFLYAFCKGLEAHEAYFAPGEDSRYPSGTRSFHDKNPGNLKFANQPKAIAEDKDSFAVFASYEDGFSALLDQIRLSIRGGRQYKPIVWDAALKSDRPQNFVDFFRVYAPAPVPNPLGLATPEKYAEDVAAHCSKISGVEVPVTTPMAALIA